MTTRLTLARPKRKSRNLGTIAARTKGKYLTEMQVVQYALEQLGSRLAKLEKAHNFNDREMREIHIGMNRQALRMQEMERKIRMGKDE